MKRKRKRKLSTYYRAPYRTGSVMLRVNESTYKVLTKDAKRAGVNLPAYVRFLIEKHVLDMDRPGINLDQWVWERLGYPIQLSRE